MLKDLAALTPPLVMAVAFIAGVVALLRSEIAPRRRLTKRQSEETGSPPDPHSEMTTTADCAQMPGMWQNGDRESASDDNSAETDAAGSGLRDLHDRG
jgi:hypothetical protein